MAIDITCIFHLGLVPGIDQDRAKALELIQGAIAEAVEQLKADYGIALTSEPDRHDLFAEAADRLAGHPGPYVEMSKNPRITITIDD